MKLLEKIALHRRMPNISSMRNIPRPVWDNNWIDKHRGQAFANLLTATKTSNPGFMELRFALSSDKPNFTQRLLLDAAREAQIDTFGWPIGAVLDNREEYRPHSTADGIVAEIDSKEHRSYDYWSLGTNGDFFLIQSLFEDIQKSGLIYFNTRIVRVTEAFLYCARLYNKLGIQTNSVVNISIVHGGIKNRVLKSAGGRRHLHENSTTTENEVQKVVSPRLSTIEENLVNLVKEAIGPLFMVFDFFEPSDAVYADIVNNFVAGKTS